MQIHLDRRVEFSTGAYSGGITTWTLPYSVKTDGSEGTVVLVRKSDGAIAESWRTTDTTVSVPFNLTNVPVVIGVLYEFRYTPTRLFYRDQQEIPDTAGRLQLRYVEVEYSNTTSMTVRVDLAGRSGYDKALASDAPATGALRLAVPAQNTQTFLNISDRSPGPLQLVGLEWEGFLTQRSRRH